MQNRYKNQIDAIYIDPPYNTDASAIIYKNGYKDSSWLSLMQDRLSVSYHLQMKNSIICVAIDDEEVLPLRVILANIYQKQLGNAVVRSNPVGRKTSGKFSPVHEYALFYGSSDKAIPFSIMSEDKGVKRYPHVDEKGRYSWLNFIRTGNNDLREDSPKMYYPIVVDKNDKLRIPQMEWVAENKEYKILESIQNDEVMLYPDKKEGDILIQKNWQRGHERFVTELDEYRVRRVGNEIKIDFKARMDINALPTTWWADSKYASSNHGAVELKGLFKENPFTFPKSMSLVQDCIRVSGLNNQQGIVLDYFAGSGTTGHAVVNLNREDGGKRKYILVEMGNYFDDVTKPRMQKVVYSKDWKDGKPVTREGISHAFKYIRLESYEDTLNNLSFKQDAAGSDMRAQTLQHNADLRRDYMLKYWLDFETKNSPSLLNIDRFADPTGYMLKLKKPGSDETQSKAIDLIESFNWLIGLHVDHLDQWQAYDAGFTREPDPELPDDATTRLILAGRMEEADGGEFMFRKVEGRVCLSPGDMQHTERVLVIWRKLTDDLEKDNLMLDEWFKKYRLSTQDGEFDVIYVNGSNNLPNLRQDNEHWKVRLIEEAFHQQMWDIQA